MASANQLSILPRLLAFPIPRPIETALERLLGIREIEAVYSAVRGMGGDRPISERLLQHLEVTHRIGARDLDHIPKRGPVVLVVNHPYGILEGAVLTAILAGVRSDVKFLANGVLDAIPEVRDMLIPVDPLGSSDARRGNPRGIRQALRFLAGGGLLVVFPAGEVSHFRWDEGAVADPPWNPAVSKILSLANQHAHNLQVVPVHVEGANSLLFQSLGVLHPKLRTALLARELLNKRRRHVAIRIGSGIPAAKLLAIPSHEERIQYLRWRTYLLKSRREFKARTSLPLRRSLSAVGPIAPAVPGAALERDVRALDASALLARSGDLSVYISNAAAIPSVLGEIGRLRELTFRAAGEGTGAATDLDRFDSHYLHLFVWHELRREVVGAYRLAGADFARRLGLYTATLFEYGEEFPDRNGHALELGRSFVRAEYQKEFAPLLLLWKGIGRYLARNPRYKILFGPVSISNQYQAVSRELMVSFLERNASMRDWIGVVSGRNPFRRRTYREASKAALDIEDLSAVVSDLEPSRTGVPVLLRQYLKLGGKLLGFNVDPTFSNALDGLILVDLTRTEPKLLERYLGKSEAAAFLAYQKGQSWNTARVLSSQVGCCAESQR